MSSTRYLTKSRFKLAMECPTKLFYTGKDNEYKNTKGDDEFLESLAEGGYQVGKMAMLLYPHGVEIRAKSNQASLSETSTLLQSHDSIVLFEPAFEFEGLLVRVDIFVKNGNSIELIEVKAKSYDSENPDIEGSRTPIKSDILPYIEDAAFQKYVVSNALPKCSINTFLMMPDKSKTATTDGLNQCFFIEEYNGFKETNCTTEAAEQTKANAALLAKVPIDKYIDIVMSKPLVYPGSKANTQNYLPDRVSIWAKAYRDDSRINPQIHKGCSECEFRAIKQETLKSGYHECLQQFAGLTTKEIDQGTVLDIWNFRRKDELIAQGIFRIQDASDFVKVKGGENGLSNAERQRLQIDGIPPSNDRGGFYFDAGYFRHERSNWRYPYHMIDFETSTVALPFFKGMRPYEPIAFQFSHHVMHENGYVEHRSQALVTEPGCFPNFNFVRALKNSLDTDDGTIFRWATHENTILNKIKEQLIERSDAPSDKYDLIQFIESITDDAERSMVDLEKIALRCFFHPNTNGQTSIKKVLPAVLGESKLLKDEYSKPIGETSTSTNFPDSFIWYRESDSENLDPYTLLRSLTLELFRDNDSIASTDNTIIAEGGSAAIAYARLQSNKLSVTERKDIENALLRYCELDTLAMAIILKGWISWA